MLDTGSPRKKLPHFLGTPTPCILADIGCVLNIFDVWKARKVYFIPSFPYATTNWYHIFVLWINLFLNIYLIDIL